MLPALACAIDDRALTVVNPDAAPSGVARIPDAMGVVRGDNAAGIVGYWFLEWDAAGCQAAGYAVEQCTILSTPVDDGLPFHPSDAKGSMCMSGLAAKVLFDPSTGQ